jgi:ribosomal protection tetracycline resistance protein
MFSGTVRTRDRLRIGDDGEGKVTAVSGPDGGAAIAAGQIGKLWGLGDVRIGDAIGTPRTAAPGRQSFAPPTLETVVVPAAAPTGARCASRSTSSPSRTR